MIDQPPSPEALPPLTRYGSGARLGISLDVSVNGPYCLAADVEAREAVLRQQLKDLVMSYDTDDSLEFLAALTRSRKALGLRLADEREASADAEVLKANGYTEDGAAEGGSRG